MSKPKQNCTRAGELVGLAEVFAASLESLFSEHIAFDEPDTSSARDDAQLVEPTTWSFFHVMALMRPPTIGLSARRDLCARLD
jgi:hypothetical protein